MTFKDRFYVPYGPDLVKGTAADVQPWQGYGYGLGATEHWAYDDIEGYVYSHSEVGGFVTVVDYKNRQVSEYSFPILEEGAQNMEINDIVICPKDRRLYVSVTDRNQVLVFDTVQRASPRMPTLVREIAAGNSPDAMK